MLGIKPRVLILLTVHTNMIAVDVDT